MRVRILDSAVSNSHGQRCVGMKVEATGSTCERNVPTSLRRIGGDSGLPTQYTYDGDSLKQSEHQSPNPPTTLIWDGADYLGEV